MSSPCISMILPVKTQYGIDVDLAGRGVFLCSDVEGQRKFLKNSTEQMGCIFMNGDGPRGSFVVGLPCTEKNFQKMAESVQDTD